MSASAKTASLGVATTVTSAESPCTLTIAGTATGASVGTVGFQTRCSDWTSNSIIVKGHVRNTDASLTSTDNVSLPFQSVSLSSDQAAGTTIATNGIYYVRDDSIQVELVVTVGGQTITIVPQTAVG